MVHENPYSTIIQPMQGERARHNPPSVLRVADYSGLTVNGRIANIAIGAGQVAVHKVVTVI